MKVCTRCGIEKDESEFYKDYRYEGGHYKSICKDCWHERQRIYRSQHKEQISQSSKEYYQTHKVAVNEKSKRWQKEHREELNARERDRLQPFKEKLSRLKTHCVKCGENRPWLIQFHHVNPKDKSFEITTIALTRHSENDVENEVSKCVCLCANCHLDFHHRYGIKPKQPNENLEQYLKGDCDD